MRTHILPGLATLVFLLIASAALALENPAAPGPHKVITLTYGAPQNPRRPDFKNADIETGCFDATPYLAPLKWPKDAIRRGYWGYGLGCLPLNGRVFLPDGPGPFPLVLTVHGNHLMKDFSDPGYEYLGRLLASRGFLFVSVDENFLNVDYLGGDYHGREILVRGLMLLEHLKLFRAWNESGTGTLAGKADLGRVALIGHSRGGEAVAVAAALNPLPRFPDNALIKLDYGFGIRGLAAIAPVEGAYEPSGQPIPLDGLDYLVLQGSQDADVRSFLGIRQYQRVALAGDNYHFKAAVFIAGANHGQFNSSWGRLDFPPPMGWVIDTGEIMPGEDQRQAAMVFISAFLEASLAGRREYVSLLAEPDRGREWLPETPILTRFQDTNYRAWADYEGDIDVTTAAAGWIGAEGLAVWREAELWFKAADSFWGNQENKTAWLGWNDESNKGSVSPAYSIIRSSDEKISPDSVFTFALADLSPMLAEELKRPLPADIDRWKAAEESEAVDLTLVFGDAAGNTASMPLSSLAPLPPPVMSRLNRCLWRDRRDLVRPWEPALETYEVPLPMLRDKNPAFDPASLKSFTLRFDLTPRGLVALDEVGTRPPLPRP